MVAAEVLSRYQIRAPRRDKVESRIMVALMRSPTGKAAGRQLERRIENVNHGMIRIPFD